jgi:hypothetical protein
MVQQDYDLLGIRFNECKQSVKYLILCTIRYENNENYLIHSIFISEKC